jgi:hypothetical protein
MHPGITLAPLNAGRRLAVGSIGEERRYENPLFMGHCCSFRPCSDRVCRQRTYRQRQPLGRELEFAQLDNSKHRRGRGFALQLRIGLDFGQ